MALIVTPKQLAQRAELYQQLSQLTVAGISIVKALSVLTQNPPTRNFREPLQKTVAQLNQGATVTDAWRSMGDWVPEFDIALIHAGEQSGRLDAVFKSLSDHYRSRAELLRRALSDLAYPMFVFHFAIFLFPALGWFLGGGGWWFILQTFGILVPIYSLAAFVIYAMQSKRRENWRMNVERLCRAVPLLGAARKSLALSRLAAALEALINAGVGIVEAWDLAAAACGSPAIQRAVTKFKPLVLAGKLPSDAVTASTEFPELFANLYHSGEVSGKLDETLRRLAVYYLEEGSNKLRMLSKILPQIFYLGVALLVAYKVITFFLGYVQQINDAGNIHAQ